MQVCKTATDTFSNLRVSHKGITMNRSARLATFFIGLCAFNTGHLYADTTHTGAIEAIKSHPLSGDSLLTEGWSWLQLSGLASSGNCLGSDVGEGDLAHIAYPHSEKTAATMALSAYMGGHSVQAVFDDTNLYQGNCRLKQLTLGVQGVVVLQSARHWRLYITNNHGHSNVSIAEMAFLDSSDGVISTASGISTGSSIYSNVASLAPSKMFDSSLSSRWASSDPVSFPQWVAMEFPSPVAVSKVAITSIDLTAHADSLQGFKFQWSSDGTTWFDIGAPLIGETIWTMSEERTYTVQ